tara:strand:+ start:1471 stop:1827 length:357 start_codon:yes stop_codon:yes gene_type:complete
MRRHKSPRSPKRPVWIPRVGETVIVQRGAQVGFWDPKEPSGLVFRQAKKTYRAKVHRVYVMPQRTSFDDPEGRGGWKDVYMVEWAGSGGYVKSCPLADVEPVPSESEMLADIGKEWKK